MNCEKILNFIDDLVEGELDEQTAAKVDSHTFACLECREQYETLKREKEIYAHYLFDAEPPNDLWANFQTRLESEKEKTLPAAKIPAQENARRTKIFGFLRLSPALAGAALLVVFGIGFGWLKFVPSETSVDKYVAKTEPGGSQLPTNSAETEKSGTANLPTQIKSGENTVALKNSRLKDKSKSLKARSASAAGKKSIAEAVKSRQKTVFPNVKKFPADRNEPNEEERLQRLQMRNLEKEIAGQIERVELLLRSFRNTRAIETIENFDVEYERMQARKLFEKNARLRREAESYGIVYAEELLNRIEPYLLDIANLEANPAPDKVLDIKERVSNQNIIASLQIY